MSMPAAKAYVRHVLEMTGLSASSLAKRVGVASTTLTRALNDPQHKFALSTSTLERIARGTGISPARFFETMADQSASLAGSTSPDPLVAAIAAFRAAMAEFDRTPHPTDKVADAHSATTWEPLLKALEEWSQPARSLDGAIAALRLAHEEQCNFHGSELATSMVRAAVRYFDPCVGVVDAHFGFAIDELVAAFTAEAEVYKAAADPEMATEADEKVCEAATDRAGKAAIGFLKFRNEHHPDTMPAL